MQRFQSTRNTFLPTTPLVIGKGTIASGRFFVNLHYRVYSNTSEVLNHSDPPCLPQNHERTQPDVPTRGRLDFVGTVVGIAASGLYCTHTQANQSLRWTGHHTIHDKTTLQDDLEPGTGVDGDEGVQMAETRQLVAQCSTNNSKKLSRPKSCSWSRVFMKV